MIYKIVLTSADDVPLAQTSVVLLRDQPDENRVRLEMGVDALTAWLNAHPEMIV